VRFLNQDMLYLLFSIPALLVIFLIASKVVRRRLGKLGGVQISQMIEKSFSGRRRRLKLVLVLIGLALMITALARPQYGSELIKVKSTGTEVIIALDVSLSMLAGDFYPSRLDKAKREIISLVENLPGENIGLIVFSGYAFVQCPLTVDHGAFRMFLDVVNVGIISDTGTDIEKAIEKAAESFSKETEADKVLIIFTDGESQIGNPAAAAEKYRNQFRIFTVGVGTAQGEPIPVRGPDGSIQGYKKNEDGGTVVSKLNEQLLNEIAASAEGDAYRSTPGEQELKSIISRIKRMEKGEAEGNYRRLYDEKYQYFLIPGIIFVMLAMFVSERRNND
jgi:Ca-activated chloride channel family protein